jgi:hypothetical protein
MFPVSLIINHYDGIINQYKEITVKKVRRSKSNLEAFFELLSSFEVDRSDQPAPTIEDVRREMYVNKLVGMLWFEGALPEDAAEPFRYYFNDDFQFFEVFDDFDVLNNLDLLELRRRSNGIKKPDWVGPKTLSKENTLSGLLSQVN